MLDGERHFDLTSMMSYQRSFQEAELRRLFPAGFDKAALHHSLCSHLIAEGQELLDCMPWMLHKKPPAMSKYTTITEMVDVMKWLLNLMILHEVTPAEFGDVFKQKSEVVESRIATEVFVRSKPGPSLVLDLDGVLVNRDAPLLAFINKKEYAGWTSLVEARKHLNSARAYERYKYAFYDSDAFLECPPFIEAIRALKAFKKDVPVVILTARDVKAHAGLHYQTIRWLNQHSVPYDALIFFEDKDRALAYWADSESIAIDDEQKNVDKMDLVCDALLYSSSSPTAWQLIVTSLDELRIRRAK